MPVSAKSRGQVIFDYEDALELAGVLGDESEGYENVRSVAPNTVARFWGGVVTITLYSTEVIRFDRDGFEFRHGGYQSVTTKDRLNRFLPVFVWQESGRWWYADPQEWRSGEVTKNWTRMRW